MKIKGTRIILASPVLMQGYLKHIAQRTHFTEPKAGEEYFMFRSGAKLCYLGSNQWSIKSYGAGNADLAAAMHELYAAEYMYRAETRLKQIDALLATPQAYRREWAGLQGRYPSGEATSSRM